MIDVGRLASVSAQTVSRYFTGGYVGNDARQRIESAITELGYRRHSAARQLKSNRVDAIGMIAMGSPNFGIWSILEGVTAGVRRAGFTLMIGQLDIMPNRAESAAEVETAVDHLLRAGVDGIIIGTPYAGGEELIDNLVSGVPIVVVSERPDSSENSVRVDSYEAGVLAMEHLINLGHRSILHVGGDPLTIESVHRKASYLETLAKHDLSALPIRGHDWTADSGFEVGLNAPVEEFTAVFAANDALASGFMSAMRTRGLHAPRDYSIVGIDNMPETRFYAPPLTTVSLNFGSLGETAVGMMLRRITQQGSFPQEVISPAIEVRASTAIASQN